MIPFSKSTADGKYTADLVTRHIERKVEKQDILSFVVNAKDPVTGTIFDFEELQLNAQTLLYISSPFGLTDIVLRQLIPLPLPFRTRCTFSSSIHVHGRHYVKKSVLSFKMSRR